MAKVARVRLPDPAPRGVPRDRLLFRLVYATGLRIGEALALHVEDLDLAPDDERLRVLGKGRRRRTILLDDPALVRELRAYLAATKYKHGALFQTSPRPLGSCRLSMIDRRPLAQVGHKPHGAGSTASVWIIESRQDPASYGEVCAPAAGIGCVRHPGWRTRPSGRP